MNRREAMAEARRLVIQEGCTYAEASELSGIPVSTLQKQGAAHGWMDQRQHAVSYADQVRAVKAAAIQAVLDSPNDPQRYHAWVQVEKAWPEHRYGATEEDPKLRLNVGLELLEELVKFLAEVDPQAQAALKPHLVPFATRLEQRYAA